MKPWSFVFATDIHVGSPRSFRFAPAWNENWNTAKRQIVNIHPDLLIVGGDLTRDGGLPEHKFELEQIKADLDSLPFPYRVTPGNMDTGNKHTGVNGPNNSRNDVALNIDSQDLERFSDVFGPYCWSFVHKNVRFSSFCDMVAGSRLPEEKPFWEWMAEQTGQPKARHHVWMMHSPLFVDRLDEPNYDITDPDQYLSWYFGIDEPHRSRIFDVFQKTGANVVLSGHVHCRKTHIAHGITFDIGPSTAFSQWGDHWPDGDASLGFMKYRVDDTGVTSQFIPLAEKSDAKGYGPGGHPPPEERDYSIAWEK